MLSDVVVVSDLNKNFGGSTDLAKKRDGSADLHTPIHPTLLVMREEFNSSGKGKCPRLFADGLRETSNNWYSSFPKMKGLIR